MAASEDDMPHSLRERPLAIMSSCSDIEMDSGTPLSPDDDDIISRRSKYLFSKFKKAGKAYKLMY